MAGVIGRLRPRGLTHSRAFDFVGGLVKETGSDDLGGLAAELAYRFFLALFPFFIFLAALGAFVAPLLGIQDPTQRIIQVLGDALPPETSDVVAKQLGKVLTGQNAGLLTFGILGSLWAASGGMLAIMKAINRAYDLVETRPFWKKYSLAVGLTLLASTFILGAFLIVVAGQFLLDRIGEILGLSGIALTLVGLTRLIIVVAMIMVAMAFLYWAAPNTKLPFKWITPGSALFTIVWLITTVLFAFYVANFGSYNATYGTLGGVVVLLLWFYVTSFIMLVGAEINAMTYHRNEGQEPRPSEGNPQQPQRRM